MRPINNNAAIYSCLVSVPLQPPSTLNTPVQSKNHFQGYSSPPQNAGIFLLSSLLLAAVLEDHPSLSSVSGVHLTKPADWVITAYFVVRVTAGATAEAGRDLTSARYYYQNL